MRTIQHFISVGGTAIAVCNDQTVWQLISQWNEEKQDTEMVWNRMPDMPQPEKSISEAKPLISTCEICSKKYTNPRYLKQLWQVCYCSTECYKKANPMAPNCHHDWEPNSDTNPNARCIKCGVKMIAYRAL